MSAGWVDRFVEGLHALEDRGELEPLVSQFAPDAGVWNIVQPEPLRGTEGARSFWERYRGQFERIHSTFERIIVSGDEAALEWRAEGRLSPGGRDVAYRGVTILRGGEQGITEFAGYYDPRPFQEAISNLQGARAQPGSGGGGGMPDRLPEPGPMAGGTREAAAAEDEGDEEPLQVSRDGGSVMDYR